MRKMHLRASLDSSPSIEVFFNESLITVDVLVSVCVPMQDFKILDLTFLIKNVIFYIYFRIASQVLFILTIVSNNA